MPFVQVQVKNMGFLDTGVNKPDTDRIADIGFQNRGDRIAKHPGTVMLLFI